ncbi:hypothetical protein VA596_33090 [Amycolatopsis sp., V23-08]|uniref:Neutral/alkaline non-lysosomal ceramidase N-terminal domain-containing protein n=1 Tax=Amycolatopsis heterodermiae TaxID=3110235 RepID=A0ABU5RDQ9_9PSEU|nr:hypothetical protein [Amycolatopsis sp., V23-08]MEA5364407.1 hypothetical protein [Amycolatopsis sp., V23-08]
MTASLLLAAQDVRITPGPGHPLGGYLARHGVATGTHDDLEASLIWLSTEDDPGVLWVALDALAVDAGLTRTLAGAVAEAVGIAPQRVLVCASHTHSGPEGWTGQLHPGLPGQRDNGLVDRMTEKITGAAALLRACRRRVRARWHAGETEAVGSNRYDPDGPHDTSFGVLELRRDDDTPAALLFDYASHPTVLGPDNLTWSADWPGATRRELAALIGRPVAAFLQGAAGDASSRFVRRGRDHDEVATLGGHLATSIARTLEAASSSAATGPVRLTRSSLHLPYRDVPSIEDSLELRQAAEGEWRRELALHGEDHPAVRIAQTRYEGCAMLASMAATDRPTGCAEVPVSVVSLGEIAWLHTPFELFASLGLRIRRGSPFRHTRVIGYTDGYLGYLPDAAGHRDGIYESYVTLFGPEAADVLVEHCLKLLRSHYA